MKQFTEEQQNKLYDLGAGKPKALRYDNLSSSFVYLRDYGVIYCQPGHHQVVMAYIYCVEKDIDWVMQKQELSRLAENFMNELEGAAFFSSVSSQIITRIKNLSRFEKLNLKPLRNWE